MELLREEMTLNELAAKYQISPVVISRWKAEFVERASEVFKKGPSEAEKELEEKQEEISELHRKVGQLTVEVDFLKKKSDEILGRKGPYKRYWKGAFRPDGKAAVRATDDLSKQGLFREEGAGRKRTKPAIHESDWSNPYESPDLRVPQDYRYSSQRYSSEQEDDSSIDAENGHFNAVSEA